MSLSLSLSLSVFFSYTRGIVTFQVPRVREFDDSIINSFEFAPDIEWICQHLLMALYPDTKLQLFSFRFGINKPAVARISQATLDTLIEAVDGSRNYQLPLSRKLTDA